MIWIGVALGLCAACNHSIIDVFRKSCSNAGIPTMALVSLPAILDGINACVGVYLSGGFDHPNFQDRAVPFALAIVTTSALLLYSKLLYQRALHLSPLSLTIPYLSFTPAFLIVTAFIFVGEVPSSSGLAGVSIVAYGGYLLSSRTVPVTSPAQLPPGSTSPALPRTPSSSGILGEESRWNDGGLAKTPSHLRGIFGLSSLHSSAQLKALDGEMRAPVGVRSMQQHDVEGEPVQGSPGGMIANAADKNRSRGSPNAGGMPCLQEPGTLLMLGVTAMWSITASLDKYGILHSPSVWVYFAAQRAVIAIAAAYMLAYQNPGMFSLMITHFWRLLGISCLELSSVLLFLEAIKYINVSYLVAIKRCNILISVLLGGLLFKENIKSRLPYVFLCLLGMLLIVLEPNASVFHQTHHT